MFEGVGFPRWHLNEGDVLLKEYASVFLLFRLKGMIFVMPGVSGGTWWQLQVTVLSG